MPAKVLLLHVTCLALLPSAACSPCTPFRCSYDGLYCVVRANRAVGRGGRSLVCQFLLVGLPGHYKANKSVSFMELRGFRDKVGTWAAGLVVVAPERQAWW